MTEFPAAGAIPIATITGDPVVRVSADATVADVAQAIISGEVGVVVVGDEGRPKAVISERDVVRVVAAGDDPARVRAGDVATKKLVWCEADTTIDQAAAQMIDHYIRHILVESDGALIGIVSARDLLGVYAGDAQDNPL